MKIKSKIGAVIGFCFSSSVIALSFQNCAQQQDLSGFEAASTAATSSVASENIAKADSGMDGAPTDAKQTLESMMALLNLKASDINMTEVNSEINYRRNLLVSQNNIALVNSPSIIAMTSLAAVVCKQAIVKEKKSSRDIFKYIDFTQGPKAYGKLGAINTFILMADRFWLRKPTKEELTYMSQAVDEYFSAIDASAMGQAAESDKLATFLCTGMLASPESYLL